MISPRSTQTQAAYEAFKKNKTDAGEDLTTFNLADEVVVREFTHWLIIENRFPYDNMTSVNHMLIPRRDVTDWSEATAEEQAEHDDIRRQLIAEKYYDAVVENLPRSKSVTRYMHLHLVRWKYTTEDGRNIADTQTK